MSIYSGQIILFLFKSNHFRIYFLYMIRYNNISRPVHDPNEPPATLPATTTLPATPAQYMRDATLSPRIDAPGQQWERSLFQEEWITKKRIEKYEDASRKEWWKHWFEVRPCTMQKHGLSERRTSQDWKPLKWGYGVGRRRSVGQSTYQMRC